VRVLQKIENILSTHKEPAVRVVDTEEVDLTCYRCGHTASIPRSSIQGETAVVCDRCGDGADALRGISLSIRLMSSKPGQSLLVENCGS